ncbi:MAG: hypothetical protein WCW78_01890 [Candidatus Paceibacterota bacterium]|jgi:hypothetical protein
MSKNPYIDVIKMLLSRTAQMMINGKNPYEYMTFNLTFHRYSRSGSSDDVVRRLIVHFFNFGGNIEKVYFFTDNKNKDSSFLSRFDTAYRGVERDGGLENLLEQTLGKDPQTNEIESTLVFEEFGRNRLREYVLAVDTIMKKH